MDWIKQFDLFLLDFDGLLVNTEQLHLVAYQQMCRNRGFDLNWKLSRFFQAAHVSATGLRDQIYETFPTLLKQQPSWDILYAEKKAAYEQILQTGHLELMPGVSHFLQQLEAADLPRCVVTNSPKRQVEMIKAKLPQLLSIPVWITREAYSKPKPDPECYRLAKTTLGSSSKHPIGFEDSMRGLKALQAAGIPSILICSPDHPQLHDGPLTGVSHFSSFDQIPNDFKSS